MKKLLCAILLFTTPAMAQQCTTLDASAYSQDQINLVPALVNSIAFSLDPLNGGADISQNGKQVTVCFEIANFDVVANITVQSLTTRYQADNAARNAEAIKIRKFEVELSTTILAANGIPAIWSGLNTAQKDLVIKSLVRIQELKNLLGKE